MTFAPQGDISFLCYTISKPALWSGRTHCLYISRPFAIQTSLKRSSRTESASAFAYKTQRDVGDSSPNTMNLRTFTGWGLDQSPPKTAWGWAKSCRVPIQWGPPHRTIHLCPAQRQLTEGASGSWNAVWSLFTKPWDSDTSAQGQGCVLTIDLPKQRAFLDFPWRH